MKPIAIIPARGGSKRLPRKNILKIADQPMLSWPVGAALASGLFGRVIVSTEDTEIAAAATQAGAEVMQRPMELAEDRATVVQVCLNLLDAIARGQQLPESFCCIYATAVFLQPHDLVRAYALLSEPPEADVIMGVSAYAIHPYRALHLVDGYLRARWPDEAVKQSQSFPPMMASNGTLYWARCEPFLRDHTFYAKRLKGYELPHERAVDIDTPADLEVARRLAERKLQ